MDEVPGHTMLALMILGSFKRVGFEGTTDPRGL